MTVLRTAIITLLFFCILPAAIYARDIIIVVADRELGMPLEGAMVSLRSGERFICDANGFARVSLPDNRQTIVQVSYPGYEADRKSVV